jgi:hypothetical protein
MDSGVMDLCDQVAALKAECARIRAAASHVLDKSSFSNQEELADLGKALRKLQIELDRFAPSMALDAPKSRRKRR